jgi:dihydrofolate synthase/folylpolyglutamate synthase
MMGRKDAAEFLRPLRGLARRIIAVPIPGTHEIVFEPGDLAQVGLSLGFTVETATSTAAALDRLKATETAPVRVLICGSLYLAGHVLSLETGVPVQSV